MWIFANVERFKPESFVIFDFYGQETCFAWQKRNLVLFPYVQLTTSTTKLPVLAAPREIKSIRSFEGRVFIVCKPTGVYKLNQSLKFCLLSNTGVGIGPCYYEVFSVENEWLFMKNKSTKNNRQLFQIQPSSRSYHNICEFTLDSVNSEYPLRRAFHQLEDGDDENICVIANERKVFVITSNDVQLIYRCEQEIVDIVAIFKEETIAGFVLVAKNSAVLVYLNNDKLAFDKVYLDSDVHGLCAGTNETSNDTIWIAHIDHERIYYSSKTVSTGTFRRIGMDNRRLLAIRNYKNKTLVGLSDNKQLLEIEIQKTGLGIPDSEEFFNLKPEMLKGSERLVDEICERAKELQLINESLLEEQEKMRKINIYAHKQAIIFLPNVRVERIAGECFLRVKFENVLPINCYIVVSLKSGPQTTYCMKLVEDSEIVVDLSVKNESLDNSLELCIDLVTLVNESQPWCLIRNYTKDPKLEKPRIQSDRIRFLTAKLNALQNLTAEGNLDMKKLSNIKKSIRREFQKS